MKYRLARCVVAFWAMTWVAEADDASVSRMRGMIETYQADYGALARLHSFQISEARQARLEALLDQYNDRLNATDFDSLSADGRIDYLLFRDHLAERRDRLARDRARFEETREALPFASLVERLILARRMVEPIVGRDAADAVVEIADSVEDRLSWARELEDPALTPTLANRAAGYVDDVADALRDWGAFYTEYDPEFTWWVREPLERARGLFESYEDFLREKWAGYAEGEDAPLLGDPIGREALMSALAFEGIAYSPEELIEIAESEFEWCRREYLKAAEELGFEDDWRAALEHVKDLHVEPGEQPELIKELADEAVDFLKERDLVTIPPLAEETWRMRMMSPERQKVSPYFTGGEVISVSFPTADMAHEDKLMSLRGNNRHFSRATVQHELIPGHHLQQFMNARYQTHRRPFRTPFWTEGWALYWEMRLWDMGFPESAEDRIGMLFWRSHRCARIIFSLRFHLGNITPEAAIDFLVERVGHERRNATAEVRRSIQGGYSPLYQAAYMLGGLQLRALHEDLVLEGDWTERAFHDAVLKQNSIPISLVRVRLTEMRTGPDWRSSWRFYDKANLEPVSRPSVEAEEPVDARERSDNWRRFVSGKFVGESLDPHWYENGDRFWYRREMAEGKSAFMVVDAKDGTEEPAFDHERLAEALEGVGVSADSEKLPFNAIRIEGVQIRFEVANKNWVYDTGDQTLVVEDSEGESASASSRNREDRRRESGSRATSPDGKWTAIAKGHNLFLRNVETGDERRLTHDGNPGASYQRDIYRTRSMNLRYNAESPKPEAVDVYWSPDSTKLLAIRTRYSMTREVSLVASSPDDQLQPRVVTYPYLKPGDEIPISEPKLFHIETGESVPVSNERFPNPWALSDFRWETDSSRVTFEYNQRGHQVLRVLGLDANSGEVAVLLEETSPTFIDYAYKHELRFLDETNEFLWMSERDGWNHLYLYDSRTGELKNQITQGEWVVRGVERVDAPNRQLWIRLSGYYPDQDPYFIHYARVNFDGSGFTMLTESNGSHSARFGPERERLVATWSRIDQAPVHELRDGETGERIRELGRADSSALDAMEWPTPEPFVAKGRDGSTDIWGAIFRPSAFESGKRYPVVEKIYAGPHGSHVPKTFREYHSAQEMAELGFIVVQIDGMGTSNRSKAFHDVCWRNIGDAGFPDRIAWMRAAAQKYPELDISRVGIYGGSAGGQNALRALLAHGDFYDAAVADCGCHDNRMDKIWWNELWMGWPVGPHYEEQSNVTQAHRLEGDLLLLVGEVDKNVDPASTLQVVDALIESDKDFEMLVMPGVGHGAAGTPYGKRRQKDFFVESLLAE